MTFKTEAELVSVALSSSFFRHLLTAYSSSTYLLEPRGLFGIPDVIIANGEVFLGERKSVEVFAFEMKLSNWRRALLQAYRYRSFADMAYVVLDYHRAGPAIEQVDRFEKANIGLLSIDTSGEIYSHFHPKYDEPYSMRLRSTVEQMLSTHISLGSSCAKEVRLFSEECSMTADDYTLDRPVPQCTWSLDSSRDFCKAAVISWQSSRVLGLEP
jgi:hypothetical protein